MLHQDIVEHNNNAMLGELKDEIEHRTFRTKKSCDSCKVFGAKLRDRVMKTAAKRTNEQSAANFDTKLRKKIIGIINRNMSSSTLNSDADIDGIFDDLMKRVQQETKLLWVNQTAFNKLEQKVTQLLINQSLKDIEKVFARGRKHKTECNEIKGLNYDEINSNTSMRIRDVVVASRNRCQSKEKLNNKPSSANMSTQDIETDEALHLTTATTQNKKSKQMLFPN